MKRRCAWAGTDPLYIEYHDKEWGTPLFDDRGLFEFLILESAQAGLSWITILRKRRNFESAFDAFDPEKVARYTENKVQALMQNEGIIRNRRKIESTITNAQAFLKIKSEWSSFSDFIWGFVDGKPKINKWQHISDIPAKTVESEKMSRDLKKRGFTFVGPTICYAYMQAVGMVNDHVVDCFRYKELLRKRKQAD